DVERRRIRLPRQKLNQAALGLQGCFRTIAGEKAREWRGIAELGQSCDLRAGGTSWGENIERTVLDAEPHWRQGEAARRLIVGHRDLDVGARRRRRDQN